MSRAVLAVAILALGAAALVSRSPAQADGLDEFNLTYTAVISAAVQPVYVTNAGDGTGRLFVVERPGTVRTWNGSSLTPFLDITDRVKSTASEQGLLSVAFAPDFASTGTFYAFYTGFDGPAGNVHISRFTANPAPGGLADPQSEQPLVTVPHPRNNHNGGQLQFGPDGYLYASVGDGGEQGDPDGNAQNPSLLLGKIFRLDVSQQAPPPEIVALGLRNPWRFSFDAVTADAYIADVGNSAWEEVNHVPAGHLVSANFGWPELEGLHCHRPPMGCDSSDYTMPVFEYGHDGENCAVTGGYVYRGSDYPALAGVYLFGDYCSGRVWGITSDGAEARLFDDTQFSISSFGTDEEGELYLVGLAGTIYRIGATSPPGPALPARAFVSQIARD